MVVPMFEIAPTARTPETLASEVEKMLFAVWKLASDDPITENVDPSHVISESVASSDAPANTKPVFDDAEAPVLPSHIGSCVDSFSGGRVKSSIAVAAAINPLESVRLTDFATNSSADTLPATSTLEEDMAMVLSMLLDVSKRSLCDVDVVRNMMSYSFASVKMGLLDVDVAKRHPVAIFIYLYLFHF
jgi:hypothetical protein